MSDKREDEIIAAPLVSNKKAFHFSWLNIGVLCAAFSIAVLIVIGSYSYWYLITSNAQLAKRAMQSQNQLEQLQAGVNVLQENINSTQRTVQQYAEDIKNLQQAVNNISQVKNDHQEKWLLAEAYYYVKLANDNLQFAENVSQAITLLKMADQEISRITTSDLTALRKTLAEDVAHLQAVPQVDVAGLYAKLMALDGQLDQLPLLSQQTNSPNKQPLTATDQKLTGWHHALKATWQALQSVIIVRYNPHGLMPWMVPEQRVFLYQNLHAILAQVTWALLHKQPAIYQSSLQQVAAWIKQYCVMDVPITRAVLNDLTQLEKRDVHPPIPTPLHTLQALNETEGL